jgi:hypothetical protein
MDGAQEAPSTLRAGDEEGDILSRGTGRSASPLRGWYCRGGPSDAILRSSRKLTQEPPATCRVGHWSSSAPVEASTGALPRVRPEDSRANQAVDEALHIFCNLALYQAPILGQ